MLTIRGERMVYSASFPLSLATGSLGYLETSGDVTTAIRSNLRMLLLTNHGERPMRYGFGCNLIEFLFEQRTNELRDEIAERIRSQITEWLPFLRVRSISVLFPEDDKSIIDPAIGIKIELTYGNIPIEFDVIFNEVNR